MKWFGRGSESPTPSEVEISPQAKKRLELAKRAKDRLAGVSQKASKNRWVRAVLVAGIMATGGLAHMEHASADDGSSSQPKTEQIDDNNQSAAYEQVIASLASPNLINPEILHNNSQDNQDGYVASGNELSFSIVAKDGHISFVLDSLDWNQIPAEAKDSDNKVVAEVNLTTTGGEQVAYLIELGTVKDLMTGQTSYDITASHPEINQEIDPATGQINVNYIRIMTSNYGQANGESPDYWALATGFGDNSYVIPDGSIPAFAPVEANQSLTSSTGHSSEAATTKTNAVEATDALEQAGQAVEQSIPVYPEVVPTKDIPMAIPSQTAEQTSTATPESTTTATSTPTETNTPTSTATATQTATATEITTPTDTATPEPTATETTQPAPTIGPAIETPNAQPTIAPLNNRDRPSDAENALAAAAALTLTATTSARALASRRRKTDDPDSELPENPVNAGGPFPPEPDSSTNRSHLASSSVISNEIEADQEAQAAQSAALLDQAAEEQIVKTAEFAVAYKHLREYILEHISVPNKAIAEGIVNNLHYRYDILKIPLNTEVPFNQIATNTDQSPSTTIEAEQVDYVGPPIIHHHSDPTDPLSEQALVTQPSLPDSSVIQHQPASELMVDKIPAESLAAEQSSGSAYERISYFVPREVTSDIEKYLDMDWAGVKAFVNRHKVDHPRALMNKTDPDYETIKIIINHDIDDLKNAWDGQAQYAAKPGETPDQQVIPEKLSREARRKILTDIASGKFANESYADHAQEMSRLYHLHHERTGPQQYEFHNLNSNQQTAVNKITAGSSFNSVARNIHKNKLSLIKDMARDKGIDARLAEDFITADLKALRSQWNDLDDPLSVQARQNIVTQIFSGQFAHDSYFTHEKRLAQKYDDFVNPEEDTPPLQTVVNRRFARKSAQTGTNDNPSRPDQPTDSSIEELPADQPIEQAADIIPADVEVSDELIDELVSGDLSDSSVDNQAEATQATPEPDSANAELRIATGRQERQQRILDTLNLIVERQSGQNPRIKDQWANAEVQQQAINDVLYQNKQPQEVVSELVAKASSQLNTETETTEPSDQASSSRLSRLRQLSQPRQEPADFEQPLSTSNTAPEVAPQVAQVQDLPGNAHRTPLSQFAFNFLSGELDDEATNIGQLDTQDDQAAIAILQNTVTQEQLSDQDVSQIKQILTDQYPDRMSQVNNLTSVESELKNLQQRWSEYPTVMRDTILRTMLTGHIFSLNLNPEASPEEFQEPVESLTAQQQPENNQVEQTTTSIWQQFLSQYDNQDQLEEALAAVRIAPEGTQQQKDLWQGVVRLMFKSNLDQTDISNLNQTIRTIHPEIAISPQSSRRLNEQLQLLQQQWPSLDRDHKDILLDSIVRQKFDVTKTLQ